jgi:hypothetical protein
MTISWSLFDKRVPYWQTIITVVIIKAGASVPV